MTFIYKLFKKILNKLKSNKIQILSFLFGSLAIFSFAPFYQSYLMFVSISVLLIILLKDSKNSSLSILWHYSFGMFSFGLSWVFISLRIYDSTPVLIAVFATLLFISIVAVYLTIFLSFTIWIFKKFNKNTLKTNHFLFLFLIFPAMFVLSEWVRSWFLSGFPWLFAGYSQTGNFLSSYATIGSVYLVSLVTILISSSIVYIFIVKSNFKRILSICFLIILLLFGYIVNKINWNDENYQTQKVALVQGNIPQVLKWNPQKIISNLYDYYDLTKSLDESYIFWPENAMAIFKQEIPDFLETLNNNLIAKNSSLLSGIPAMITENDEVKYFNSAKVFGVGYGEYYKSKLVPFGEYFPMKTLLKPIFNFMDIPMDDFTAGKKNQKNVTMKDTQVNVSICYETVFPDLINNNIQNSKLMVVMSDDAWFGDSIAPWQQLEISQMRAIESSKYLLTITNDGVTAVVNNKGKIIKTIPQFKEGILISDVKLLSGKTFWNHNGLVVIFFILFGMIFFGFGRLLVLNSDKTIL